MQVGRLRSGHGGTGEAVPALAQHAVGGALAEWGRFGAGEGVAAIRQRAQRDTCVSWAACEGATGSGLALTGAQSLSASRGLHPIHVERAFAVGGEIDEAVAAP